jgi:small-conductance mechanosensitive channel
VTQLLDDLGLSTVEQNLLVTAVVILVLILVRWVVSLVLRRRIKEAEARYRSQKWVTYVATAVALVFIINIWLGGVEGALAWLGIVSAGLAIALTDVLKNLAGWLFILTRRPFKVGDRVEIGGTAGDVVDVRVFRFTVLEIGNWVAADQSTGRLVHIPNGMLFTESLANFTEGFPLIWDETAVLVTFESDWELAEQLIRQVLAEEAPDPRERNMAAQIRRAANEYFIRYTHLDPTTYVSVLDSGVNVTARYLVSARERRGVADALWRGVLRAFAQHDSVELAYPTVRTFIPDRLRLQASPPGEVGDLP